MELFKLIIFTLSQFSKQVNNFCHESGDSLLFVLYKLARSQFSLLRRLNDSLKKGKASSPNLTPPPPRLAAFVKFESKKRHSVMIRYITVVPISAHFSMSASLEVRSLIRKTVVYVSVLQLFFFYVSVQFVKRVISKFCDDCCLVDRSC